MFWVVGARLFLAGLSQALRPAFTARRLLGIHETASLQILQELGFANVALGLIGILTIAYKEWILPSAIAGLIFLGLAGIRHIVRRDRMPLENLAMVSNAFAALVLLGYVAAEIVQCSGISL